MLQIHNKATARRCFWFLFCFFLIFPVLSSSLVMFLVFCGIFACFLLFSCFFGAFVRFLLCFLAFFPVFQLCPDFSHFARSARSCSLFARSSIAFCSLCSLLLALCSLLIARSSSLSFCMAWHCIHFFDLGEFVVHFLPKHFQFVTCFFKLHA